jgi:hypothetical protein
MGVRVGVSELCDDPMCELRQPLPRLALLPRHRLGWRCVAVVLRQWLYRQKGALSRGGLSWVGSIAGSGWGLSSWSRVSRWEPRRSPRRHRYRARAPLGRRTCTRTGVQRGGVAAEPRAPLVKSERVEDAVDTPAGGRPAPPSDGNRAAAVVRGWWRAAQCVVGRTNRFVGRSVRRCDVDHGGTVPIREPMWETA